MKAQFSRISYQVKKQYSAVYQQQGRMITDADWNELVAVIKERQQRASMLSIGSGVPRESSDNSDSVEDIIGVLNITEDRITSPGVVSVDANLQWGTVVVNGIHAEVMPDDESISDFNYYNQRLFLQPPSLPASGEVTYYADVWERLVISLQDESLKDPALHGADTCVRTQIMAQVKYAENKDNILDELINPKSGNAVFSLVPADNTTSSDDPCLVDTAITNQSGNYLFRLEVHHVNTNDGIPSQVTLKWSFENAAEAHNVADAPSEFKQGNGHYEFFDDITEQNLGVHLRGGHLQGAAYKIPHLHAVSGYPEDIPKDINNEDYLYVRRWDGYCILKQDEGSWILMGGKHLGQDIPSSSMQANGTLTISLGDLEMVLECANKSFVVGDYWLALLRQSEVNHGEPDVLSELPVGVLHHYLVLGSADLTSPADPYSIKSLSLDDVRQLSFPSLTDITADRVGYDPTVADSRWNDIKDNPAIPNPVTVQDAIDQMANNLEASDIKYELPLCDESDGVPSFKSLIENYIEREDENGLPTDASGPNVSIKIKSLWDAILCELDAAKIPYDPKIKPDRWLDINETSGLNQSWLDVFDIGDTDPAFESPVKSSMAIDKYDDIWLVISKPVTGGYNSRFIKINSDGTAGVLDQSFSAYVSDIVVDDDANIYATGHYLGTTNFGGAGDALPDASLESAFIVKFNSDGAFDWSISFASALESRGHALSVDGLGQIIFTGYTQGEREAPGNGEYTPIISSAFMVAQIQSNKTVLWSHEFTGPETGIAIGYRIAVTDNNAIMIVGNFTESLIIGDPPLTSDTGNLDVFIARLETTEGKPVWAESYGASIYGPEIDVCIDSDNGLIMTGGFTGTINFGGDDLVSTSAVVITRPDIPVTIDIETLEELEPGEIETRPIAKPDIFLVRFVADNNDGYEEDWSDKYGGSDTDIASGVIIDSDNNIALTGIIRGRVDFGGGPIGIENTRKSFIALLNSAGEYQWASTLVSDTDESVQALAQDKQGHIVLTGLLKQTLTDELTAGTTIEIKSFVQQYSWGQWPLTVQQAIDDLVENLESSDIEYVLPDCELIEAYASPTIKSYLEDDIPADKKIIEGGVTKTKIEDLWNALLCKLDAARIPYNPDIKSSRWEDINEATAGMPVTVQGAIDGLIENLESSDIGYILPGCNVMDDYDSPTLKSFIENDIPIDRKTTDTFGVTKTKIEDVWNALLCNLDAARIPYNAKLKSPRWNDINDDSKVIESWTEAIEIGLFLHSEDYSIGLSSIEAYQDSFWLTLPWSRADVFNTRLIKFDANKINIFDNTYPVIVTDMAIGKTGEVYLTGYYKGEPSFGSVDDTLTHADEESVFIAKFDADGVYQWSEGFTGALNSHGFGLALDDLDNPIITGYFKGEIDFSGSGEDLTSTTDAGGEPSFDMFVVKFYTANGGYDWSESYGGPGEVKCHRVAIDSNNDVFAVGQFSETINFASNPLTSHPDANGDPGKDIFLVKFDGTNGQDRWADRFGGENLEASVSLIIDDDNLIMTGFFSGTINFGDNDLHSISSSNEGSTEGGFDIFLVKFTPEITSDSYQHAWSKSFGQAALDMGMDLAIDSQKNIILTGTFTGAVDLGGGKLNQDSEIFTDAFIASYNSDGDYLWSIKKGEAEHEQGQGVTLINDDTVINVVLSIDISVADNPGNLSYTAIVSETILDKGTVPFTVQEALDDLAENLESSDIKYTFPDCNEADGIPSFKSLIVDSVKNKFSEDGKTKSKIDDLWNAIFCELDAEKLPYDPNLKSSRWLDVNDDVSVSVAWEENIHIATFSSSDEFYSVQILSIDSYNDDFWVAIPWSYEQFEGLEEEFNVRLIKYEDKIKQIDVTLPAIVTQIVLGQTGEVYITGFYKGEISLGGPILPVATHRSVFVAKLDASGVHQWSNGFVGTLESESFGLAIDDLGNPIISGNFQGSIDFSGRGEELSSTEVDEVPSYDMFLAKFNTDNGTYDWSKSYGGPGEVKCYRLAVDGNNVVATGTFNETINFISNPLTSNPTTNENPTFDIFIAKFDVSDGNDKWAAGFGGLENETSLKHVIDGDGNLILTGMFIGSINFGGNNLVSLPSDVPNGDDNNADVFLVKFTPSDTSEAYDHAWSDKYGHENMDMGIDLVLDSQQNVILTGTISGPVDFGGGALNGGENQYRNAFIASFRPDGQHIWSTLRVTSNFEQGFGLALVNDNTVLNIVLSFDINSSTITYNAIVTESIIDESNMPFTVQQALDDLVENLESSDISYKLPSCSPTNDSVRSLLPSILNQGNATPLKINALFNALLCELDATTIPYDRNSTGDLTDGFVNKEGAQTITGPLTLDDGTLTPSGDTLLDVQGTVEIQGFKLTTGTPNQGDVLTYDSTTAKGIWDVPSPVGWNVSGTNIISDIGGNTNIDVTIGGELTVNGIINGTVTNAGMLDNKDSTAFSLTTHNHDGSAGDTKILPTNLLGVTSNVNATNLNALTAGSNSDASSQHYHATIPTQNITYRVPLKPLPVADVTYADGASVNTPPVFRIDEARLFGVPNLKCAGYIPLHIPNHAILTKLKVNYRLPVTGMEVRIVLLRNHSRITTISLTSTGTNHVNKEISLNVPINTGTYEYTLLAVVDTAGPDWIYITTIWLEYTLNKLI